MTLVRVRVPATTANLGPGFDVLGLALDWWNTLEVRPQPPGAADHIVVAGEGAATLPRDARHRSLQAIQAVYDAVGVPRPRLHLQAHNAIPLGSGLGSSAAAALAGALAANALLGWPLSRRQLLSLVARLEGHPDNAAPALYGGLTACGWDDDGQVWVRPLPVAEEWLQDGLTVWVALPAVNLSTAQARQALPEHIPLKDAAYNLGQAVRVVEAFRTGDAVLLGAAMRDRWHQPYRLRLIPGASEALHAARQAGAWAAALSGAGPSVVAFAGPDSAAVGQALRQTFAHAGVSARVWRVVPTRRGAHSDPPPPPEWSAAV